MMLGQILGSVIRLVNVPAKAIEKIMDTDDEPIISLPLEKLAEAFEEADK